MVEIQYLILCAALMMPALFIAYAKTRKKLNIVSFIAIWYGFWCMISCTEICAYAVEFDYGRLYIMSNILVLATIFSITMRRKPQLVVAESVVAGERVFATSHILDIARIIVLVFQFYYLGSVLLRLLQGNLTIYMLRTVAYSSGEDALFSSLAGDIYFVFIKGFVNFDAIFEIVKTINGKKRPSFMPIVNLFMFCLTTLNRIELVRTVILIVVCVIISGRSIREILNRSKIVKRIVKFFVVAVAVLVLLRFVVKDSDEGLIQSVLNTIFKDFSIPFVTFNRFFKEYLDGVRIVDCTIFDILFGGPIKVLEPLLNLLGIDVFNYNGYLAERLNYGVNVGRDQVLMTNAFYSMYYNFVNGGGLVVPYFVSGAFGWLLGVLYNRWQRSKSDRNFALLAFSTHVVIFGLLRWEMYAHWSWVAFFFILLFTGKRRVKFIINRKQ